MEGFWSILSGQPLIPFGSGCGMSSMVEQPWWASLPTCEVSGFVSAVELSHDGSVYTIEIGKVLLRTGCITSPP